MKRKSKSSETTPTKSSLIRLPIRNGLTELMKKADDLLSARGATVPGWAFVEMKDFLDGQTLYTLRLEIYYRSNVCNPNPPKSAKPASRKSKR